MAQNDIQGQVVDAQGNPVSGAIVELTKSYQSSPDSRGNVFRTTTDSNGNYIFTGHQEGDGTTQEWHVSCYNYDGTVYVNSFNNPGVTADLPSNAIPDSGDLHARYDATALTLSDTDPVSTWTDETGNGHDLTTGTAPTFRTNIINGNPVVRFDGVDDFLNVAYSTIPQPFQIFIVAQKRTLSGSSIEDMLDGGSQNEHYYVSRASVGDNFQAFAGDTIDAATVSTDPLVHSILFNGASSEVRVNQTSYTGDLGSNSSTGLSLARRPGAGTYGDYDIGELLFYPQDKSGIQTDVEQYLADKWGIAL